MTKFRWLCPCPQWTATSAANWHLPATEQKQEGHLLSASGETDPRAPAAGDRQHPKKEFRVGREALWGPGNLGEHVLVAVFSRSAVSDSLRPLDGSPPCLPVHHHLPELAQTQVHRVGDGPGNSCSMSRRVDCLCKSPICVSSPPRKIYLFSPLWIYLITYLCPQRWMVICFILWVTIRPSFIYSVAEKTEYQSRLPKPHCTLHKPFWIFTLQDCDGGGGGKRRGIDFHSVASMQCSVIKIGWDIVSYTEIKIRKK